eukprot:m.9828 g.9828  ORF g.9828 m.9828 type:complete len:453 (-) comp4237_c0_seq1:94-1452(-)
MAVFERPARSPAFTLAVVILVTLFSIKQLRNRQQNNVLPKVLASPAPQTSRFSTPKLLTTRASTELLVRAVPSPPPRLSPSLPRPAGEVTPRCLVNSGRQCTIAEFGAVRNLSVQSNFRQLTLANVEHQFSVKYIAKDQIYNPGLVVQGSKIWMVVRHEGKNASGRWLECPEASLTGSTIPCPVRTFRMISFVVLARLDAELFPSGPLETIPYNFQWDAVAQKKQERQLGPEDPRPFEWGDETYVAVNGPPIRSSNNIHCVRNMKILRIFPKPGLAIDLETNDTGRIEKNWAPIAPSPSGEHYFFSRRVEPFEILNCGKNGQCTQISNNSKQDAFAPFLKKWRLKALHLGTNAVKLPSGLYIAILHGISAVSARTYLNFVYVFKSAPEWTIVGVGANPLDLPTGSIIGGFVWTSNLVWMGDRLVVCYTVKDRTSNFWITNTSSLLSDINTFQ